MARKEQQHGCIIQVLWGIIIIIIIKKRDFWSVKAKLTSVCVSA